MADGVGITAGLGTTIATDDVGGVHYQRVKLVDGTADSSALIPGEANRGLKTYNWKVARFSATPTISAGSAYAAGDALGGLLTFANVARFSGAGVRLKSFIMIDEDLEQAATELVLFDRTFTASTNNAVFDPTDADLLNLVAVVPIALYAAFNDNCVGYSCDIDIPLVLNGTSLFGQLVTRGTPTYTATDDITVILTVLQE
jgi:hypothetical protein